MNHLFCSLVVVLCAAQVTLTQDCSTEAGQLEFLRKGAETDPDCYNPVIKLRMSDGDDLPTTAQIEVVSIRYSINVKCFKTPLMP